MFDKITGFIKKPIFIQIILLSFLWMLASGMTVLLINLVNVSGEVDDHQTASIAISIVGIIVFWILAGILTYVLTGLYRGRNKENEK
jgi:heme/copper-type cytochrome/quinol oxidase subunit 2